MSTHSLRAASLLLSGSSCTYKGFILIFLKMSFSHRRSCSLSKSSGRNSNWGKLSSHLKTILLCNLLDQVVHLEERDFSIEDLVWLRIHLAGRSSGSCGSCHGPFHHTCVNIQVFEGFLKLIHHLGKGSGNIFVHNSLTLSVLTGRHFCTAFKKHGFSTPDFSTLSNSMSN